MQKSSILRKLVKSLQCFAVGICKINIDVETSPYVRSMSKYEERDIKPYKWEFIDDSPGDIDSRRKYTVYISILF